MELSRLWRGSGLPLSRRQILSLGGIIPYAEQAPTTLVLGTLGIALILVLAGPLWRQFRVLVARVIEVQEITLEWVKKILGNSLFTLGILAAPSWVALSMAYQVTHGEDPMNILVGALAANAVIAAGAGVATRSLATAAIVAIPGFIVYQVIINARPLAQAGTIVLASWFLLLGGLRISIDFIRAYWPIERWRRVPALNELGIPPRIWTPLLTLFAVACLVLGARWLLGWQYSSDYDQIVVSERPCGAANPC